MVYLRALLAFSLLAPVLHLLYARIHWGVVVSGLIVVAMFGQHIMSYYYPSYGLALYALGGLLAYKKIQLAKFFSRYRRPLLLLGIVGLTIAFVQNVKADVIREPSDGLKFCGGALFCACVTWIDRIMNCNCVKRFVAPAAFFVYVSHIVFAQIFVHAFGSAFSRCSSMLEGLLLNQVISFVLTIVICVCAWHILNSIVPKVLAVLDGRYHK